MGKIKKMLKNISVINKTKRIVDLTNRGYFKGNKIANVFKYLNKFTIINGENYKGYSKIEYTRSESDYFFYSIDEYVISNFSNAIYENFSLDYSLILNNSLLELQDKYKENHATTLMVNECKRIVNCIEKDNIKRMFETMLDNKCNGFQDALQRILFVNQIMWQTGHRLNGLGRLDVILEKYYKNDILNGNITLEFVETLLKDFFLVLHGHYKFKSNVQLGDTGQIIILGGLQSDGAYFCNDLTKIILEVLTSINVPDPKILMRVSSKMPQELLELSMKCIAKGTGGPLLSNDDIVIPEMISFGYDEYDAYNYSTSACWEVLPLGNSTDQNNLANLNFIKVLNNVITKDSANYDTLKSNYKEAIKDELQLIINNTSQIKYSEDPILALFINENKNSNLVKAKYNNLGFLSVGISNAVNALLNIKKYVYEEKGYSLEELIHKEDEEQFNIILKNENIKFGEDQKAVIELTNEIMRFCADCIKKYNSSNERKIKLGYSSPAYLTEAKNIAKSLDGRKDGEPFNVHISCSKPLAYTELINFSSQLDYSQPIINGNVVDFSVTPDLINNNIEKFVSLINTGIKKGFYQMQINVVSSQRLIEAKNNPQLFPNLIVRVWGYSSYFNDLSEEYKDLLIERAKNYEIAN